MLFAAQQGLGGDLPQGNDHLGPDGDNLLFQEGQAGLNFIRLRVPVRRRPAFDDVGDIVILPSETHPFGVNIGQQLHRANVSRFAL